MVVLPRPVVVFSTVALVLSGARAHALDPRKAITQYSHQVWRMEEGLPQNSVQSIVQTRDGYLWIGTQEGLVRFDGVRFTVFSKSTTDAIRNNNIQSLCEARDGSLWIATAGGGLARLRDGRFTLYTTREGLSSDVLWSVVEDRDGNIWVGTAGGGLDRLRHGRFTAYGAKDGLSSDKVLSIRPDSKGNLWVGTDGGGLNRFKESRFTAYTAKDGLAGDTVYAIQEDREGNLWVGTSAGLTRLRDGAFTNYVSKDGLAADRVEALLLDRDGNLWIGTYGGGLSRMQEGRITSFASKEGLSDNMVRSLYEDQEGSLWIGTRTGGLNRLKDGKVVAYSTKEGLSHDVVWTVYEDRKGDIWIGTDGGGLNRFRDGSFTSYTTRDGLSHDMVRSIAQDAEGALWIGTWGAGLNRFKGGKFTAFTTKDGLSHNFIRAVYEDRGGNLWIGTYGGGLNRLRDGRFTTYTTRDGLGSDTIYCIHEDRNGDLWVGTRGGGLSRLRDGRFVTYTTKDGLSDEVVLSIHEDAQGSLWIGTTGGLNRLKGGRFASVSRKDGLFDDVAYQILEDRKGNLWMSSNRGIFRASKRELEDFLEGRVPSVSSVAYAKADGMKGAECNGGVQPAGWKARDGRLWFPTIRGVAVIDPENLKSNNRPPPVVIEQVSIDGQPVDPKGVVRAPPGRGELQFHYAGLSFLVPEKVRFKRRLEGFDRDWIDAGTLRDANYTNIPPGAYTFRVIASNEDGVWNETGAAFRFDLKPHLYQTVWFRALGVVVLVVAGTGLYGLRVQQLKARQGELVLLVDERTEDLALATRGLEEANQGLREAIRLKDEVVSIVAHDFRSPLTVIRGYGEVLEGLAPDGESRRMCGIINAQTRHLAALAEDTLTMSRIETGTLPLGHEPVEVASLVRSIVEARTAQAGADISLETPDDSLVVMGDPDRLFQVVDNLIGNAIKYSPDGASVCVAVVRNDDGVRVSVADKGMGIPPEDIPRLFGKFSRLDGARQRRISGTGLGLYICRSIVEAHGGRIWVESQPGQGSTFRFTLPSGGRGS